MGKRGPKPTPTAILRLRGSRRAGLRNREVVPSVLKRLPPPPKWLRANAQDVWRDLGPRLLRQQILTGIDLLVFSLLCQAVGDYITADGEASDFTAKDRNDALKTHPLTRVRRDLRRDILSLASHFGMSPTSRVGLTRTIPAPAEGRDDLKKFFGT